MVDQLSTDYLECWRNDLRLYTKPLPTREKLIELLDSHIYTNRRLEKLQEKHYSPKYATPEPEPEKPKQPEAVKLFDDLVRGRITVPEVATGLLSMLLPR